MSNTPIQIDLTDEAFEKAARTLVPFAYGAFEQHGSAERPFEAGKPNANCYNAVRVVIAALQSAADTPAPAPVVDRAAAFERIVAARKKHVDAVAAYNARLKIAKAERECGDWSTKLDAVYRAMSDAQSDFIRTCQDTADAALSPFKAKEE